MPWELSVGAQALEGRTRFRVWAPAARDVELLLYSGDRPLAALQMAGADDGYYELAVSGVAPGARYMYRLDGGPPRPDPASRSQPDGVHGPSEVVDPRAYRWSDDGWRGVALEGLVVYELHVGAATEAGTFDALVERLDHIRELGATALELMPVADFPGDRGWGYDGVSLFAPSRAYGGPEGLRRLVDAAHARGLAVILDVVYNHLGPDGNYLREFSPGYFTDRHHTPWGDAINVDGPDSAPVRELFVANAMMWAHEYHIDGLRLDATHAILDDSPLHIVREIAERVRASLPPGRRFLLIAEHEGNHPHVVAPAPAGWGLDAVWADDFHHQVRVALTGEREGYYADYSGSTEDLAATVREGWYEPGLPADAIPPPALVHCIQNHDQVGNRALGDRLHHAVGLDAYRAVSALLLLSPYTPLLWMGQEWAASTPFQFFTDHNRELGRLVTEGRRREFAAFAAFAHTEVPDPQDVSTFLRSKLRWDELERGEHAGVLRLYRDLLELRRDHPALRARGRAGFQAEALSKTAVALRRASPEGRAELLLLVNLRGRLELDLAERAVTRAPEGRAWSPLLSSEDPRYGGAGAATIAGASARMTGPGALALHTGDGGT